MWSYLRLVNVWAAACVYFLLINYIGIACSQPESGSTAIRVKGTSSSLENPYCSTSNEYSNGLIVSGKAQFTIRNATRKGLGGESDGIPIKFAEVQILNSENKEVQCSETDETGSFSFVVPRNQNLKVLVNSRSMNNKVKASILDTPQTNKFYSISQNFDSNSSANTINLPMMTASAKSSEVAGGAFNILFNVLRANESLRFYICGSILTTCSPDFDVAPKVTAYWKAGINPYIYFGGDPTAGLSFYVPGTDKLYILGGINGEVNNTDTDHFDDSVISHEYGHFIEDHYSKSDSPGGSHDGDHILDARLTWSEGWADFFSAAVRGTKYYSDSYGNEDGMTGYYFNYDLDANDDNLDISNDEGEGNFREFAIARALWDGIDPLPLPNATDPGTNGSVSQDDNNDDTASPSSFTTYWHSFNKTLSSSSFHFRNVGLFLEFINDTTLMSSTAMSFQGIKPSRADYAQPLPITIGSACPIKITANDPPHCMIGRTIVCSRGNLHACCSNQLASNDFYDVNVDGSFHSIDLDRVTGTAELDIYLYKDGYTFGDSDDMAAMGSLGTSFPKSVNVDGIPHGHYILNISVYTGNAMEYPPGEASYQLYFNGINGTQVCP